jgi:RHS repeat-associated protein
MPTMDAFRKAICENKGSVGERMKHVITFLLVISLVAVPCSDMLAGRYYDARVARFTTPDPILNEKPPGDLLKQYGLVPFSLSPYNYGSDNPVRYIDPDGRFPFLPIFFVAACSYFATQYSGDHPGGSPGLVTDAVVLGGAAAGSYAP